MNRFAFAALVLLNGVPATAHASALPAASDPNLASPYETRKDAIEPVEKIAVDGAFQVSVYTSSDEPNVQFHGPPEMVADAEARIENDTLVIAFKDNKPWSWNAGAGVNVSVSLPKVSAVYAGLGRISVMQPAVDEFTAITTGAGRINVEQLAAANVIASTGGSGSIELEGTSDHSELVIGGAGSIDAKRLRSAKADIGVAGAGSVYADVANAATVARLGAGKVEIVGGATCLVSPPSRKSGVECR
ncbi:MAG: DUF2807 domain-containing protein [Pseudomonadota bacterium]